MKRKLDLNSVDGHAKRLKISTAEGQTRSVKVTRPAEPASSKTVAESAENSNTSKTQAKAAGAPQRRIKKLVPPRPFPSVPLSVSATGPRSAHAEGKNYLCITRKTSLGTYLRRCKNAVMQDGYKTLHLSAMGAAIPHLALLAVALPGILPFAAEEIRTEVVTGTVEVQDEVVPEDEDEDISYQTRGKSTLGVVIKIGNGEFEGGTAKGGNDSAVGRTAKRGKGKAKEERQQVVYQEPEQMDIG